MIRVFDSIASLRQKALDLDSMSNNSRDRGYGDAINSWVGESLQETIKFSELGDRRLVAEAEKLLDQLETQIEVPKRIWERSPAGSFCVVPDVLAGLPTPMRRQREIGDERAPITVLAVSTSSAAISHKTLMKRGTAILAFVLAIARLRPVSLDTVSILDGHVDPSGESIISTRIETAPLDISMAAYALTSAGFARRLNYSISKKLDKFMGSWPAKFQYGHPTGGGYYTYLAEVLSPDPSRTLVIGAAQLNDPILSDPVSWINTQIKRFTETQQDL